MYYRKTNRIKEWKNERKMREKESGKVVSFNFVISYYAEASVLQKKAENVIFKMSSLIWLFTHYWFVLIFI